MDRFEAQGRSTQLFAGGVKSSDVRQGASADCYLTSSLAAVAKQNPAAIRDLVKPNPDGTVTVTFRGRDGERFPVTVDRNLPAGAEAKNGELWPALVEKAYAQWKGGYSQIGRGGNPYDALVAITGERPVFVPSQGTNASNLFGTVKDQLARGSAITVMTPADSGQLAGSGLRGQHVYSVERAIERDGQQFLELRDPAGSGSSKVLVPASTFQKNTTGLYVALAPGQSVAPPTATDSKVAADPGAPLRTMSESDLSALADRTSSDRQAKERSGDAKGAAADKDLLRAIRKELAARKKIARSPMPEYASQWHQASTPDLVAERNRVRSLVMQGGSPDAEKLNTELRLLDEELRRRTNGGGPRVAQRPGSIQPQN